MASASPPPPAYAATGPFHRALVLANPISGRGKAARAAHELSEGLNRMGIPAEVYLTQARRDGVRLLRELDDDTDLVCAVGGDGTLREVLEGLRDPGIAVASIPFGTANVVANELGLPRDVHHALEIVAGQRARALDVASVNGKLSIFVTGVGLDALTVQEMERRRRGPIRKSSYVGAFYHALRSYRPPRLRVAVDGEELDAEYGLVIVSNTVGYGGVLRLSQDARLDDGQLEVYLFRTGSLPEVVRGFARGLVGKLPGGPVAMRRARRVEVRSDEEVPFQVDGDFGGTTPVEVEVATTQYRILAP
ncbi:MAG: diacylglycerol kinase family protein [Planctomycetota bacterium]